MKFKDYPYKRIEIKELEKDFAALFERFDLAENAAAQFAVHKEYYELTDHAVTMSTIAHIRHDIDITDAFYEKEQEYYDQIMPILQNLIVNYQKKLYGSAFKEELQEMIGPVAFKNMELAFRSMDEKLIPLMQEENTLRTEYDKLIAGAKIDWDGEILNLSLLRPYLTNADRTIRQKAWNKYENFFAVNGDKLDEIYDRLVKNRTQQAREMGYENYLELGYYRMNRNCYDAPMVKTFRDQIKSEWVPFVERMQKRRKERLGVDRLSYIDEGVYFAEGNPSPKGTPEEIMEAGRTMYQELSPETAAFITFMMDQELFDVLGRKNKKAGGYMTFLPDYKAPFIFANFNSTSDDVDVMTHECGHAFQGYLSAEDPIREHADITMETAEIHSMSMEFFTEPWMNRFFGDRADDYRAFHLESAAAFIPYGCLVDEFQHVMYEHPEMTPSERHTAWRQLEQEYKPHLDYAGAPYFEKGGFWQKQLHIYDLPFYYIDYCLAQTCALQYKGRMDQNYGAAWESYLTLCRLSASDFFTGLLEQSGLESPFSDGSIRHLIQNLEHTVGME